MHLDLTTHYCIKTAFVTTQKCISVVPVPINIDLSTNYSGTSVIRHLSFPTSCDIQQKFMVPKYFCYLK